MLDFKKHSNHYKYFLLLILLIIPSYFINLNGINGWGGDFSQYIQQSLNIIKGIPQSTQYYIFNPSNMGLAPQNYSPGFPLILAPLIKKWGVDYLILAKFISIASLILFICWFIYLKKISNAILSLVFIVLVSYSNFIFQFKNFILADIPFSVFVILTLYIAYKIEHESSHLILKTILLIIVSSIAILIKPIGLTIVLSMFLYSLIIYFKQAENYKKVALSFLVSGIISFLVYKFYVPYLLGLSGEQNSHFFTLLFSNENLVEEILINLNYYYNYIFNLFSKSNENGFIFFNTVLIQIIGLSCILGFYKSMKRKIDFKFIFFIIFLGVLLFFPYHQGFRYILPITPIFLYYIITGFESFPFSSSKKYFILALFIIFGYILPLRIDIVNFAKQNSTIEFKQGPLSNESEELFSFIKTNTNKNDVIVFHKPRVLGLHTQRKSFSNNPKTTNLEKVEKDIYQFSAKYLLQCKDLKNYSQAFFIESRPNLEIVFSNKTFTLYKL